MSISYFILSPPSGVYCLVYLLFAGVSLRFTACLYYYRPFGTMLHTQRCLVCLSVCRDFVSLHHLSVFPSGLCCAQKDVWSVFLFAGVSLRSTTCLYFYLPFGTMLYTQIRLTYHSVCGGRYAPPVHKSRLVKVLKGRREHRQAVERSGTPVNERTIPQVLVLKGRQTNIHLISKRIPLIVLNTIRIKKQFVFLLEGPFFMMFRLITNVMYRFVHQ